MAVKGEAEEGEGETVGLLVAGPHGFPFEAAIRLVKVELISGS
jgi:hypothetical protein